MNLKTRIILTVKHNKMLMKCSMMRSFVVCKTKIWANHLWKRQINHVEKHNSKRKPHESGRSAKIGNLRTSKCGRCGLRETEVKSDVKEEKRLIKYFAFPTLSHNYSITRSFYESHVNHYYYYLVTKEKRVRVYCECFQWSVFQDKRIPKCVVFQQT